MAMRVITNIIRHGEFLTIYTVACGVPEIDGFNKRLLVDVYSF